MPSQLGITLSLSDYICHVNCTCKYFFSKFQKFSFLCKFLDCGWKYLEQYPAVLNQEQVANNYLELHPEKIKR